MLHQQRSEERQRQRQRRCDTPGKESVGSESKKEEGLDTGAGAGDTEAREGRASVLRNPAPGDPGRTLPIAAKAPGAFPGSLVPFCVDQAN